MKSLLLLSGGLDSTVLLGYILSLAKKCVALSFDYGQRHRIELERAKTIAVHYEVEHYILSIDPLLFSSAESSLTNETLPVNSTNTYVPGRNLLFLAHAASFAESKNISEIYFGSNAQDVPFFPDCRRAFFDAMEHALYLGTKTTLSILTPFAQFSKKEIIALGKRLSVPLELSLSCYDPKNSQPCGICPACVVRHPDSKN